MKLNVKTKITEKINTPSMQKAIDSNVDAMNFKKVKA
jgi:hypothetical protein